MTNTSGATTTQQKLIEAGQKLFYRYGFHSVGLDQILKQVDVTKTTFYNHFESKEQLIQKVIDFNEEGIRQRLREGALGLSGQDSTQQVLAIFDVLQEFFEEQDFNGCMLINAAMAFPDPNDPIHQTAIQNKKALGQLLVDLAKSVGIANAEALVEKFHLLFDGAIISRHVFGNRDAAKAGKELAAVLIAAQQETESPATEPLSPINSVSNASSSSPELQVDQ
ncbi:MAG: TetR/AcrR family transcriptional regulator [Pirellulales bacterium]|nr:TetR/AcrR family transcriptional regulator [Pirellulales bacterium]